MIEFAAISNYVGAGAFGVLSMLLIAGDRGHFLGRLLTVACIVTTTWFAFSGVYYSRADANIAIAGLSALEILRDLAWLSFLTAILRRTRDAQFGRLITIAMTIALLTMAAILVVTFLPGVVGADRLDAGSYRKLVVFFYLVIAILGLLFIEQVLRSTRADSQWAIKHLVIALGAIFAYDFYLYADGLLFARVNPDLWDARGAVNALTVPLLALAAARNRNWELDIFVSRRVVFHTTAAVGAGVYLLLMSAAGYYLNSYGGTWGAALQAVFLCGAILLLVTLIFSTQLRSRLRIFLAKHFYKNRYEYGEVWLSFTRQLSTSDANPEQLRATILRAIADIVDSTGGIMWTKDETASFIPCAEWSVDSEPSWVLAATHPLVQHLETSQACVVHRGADRDDIAAVNPPWLAELPRAWITVPILQGEELLAFLTLMEPRASESLTAEDRDLLHTVGRQAASYLAFLRATEALAEVRQFEAFNRLSAFLVHDLKNVVAQLSLIVKNSERHRDNPEFITDAFTTIGDATAKINRMLANLRKDSTDTHYKNENVELNALIDAVISRPSGGVPHPRFERSAVPVRVTGNAERLQTVLEHMIQNAQEATDPSGEVSVGLQLIDGEAKITITDTGIGMDAEFIRRRLFRPFDTTKGKAGMGIGVYESRHIVTTLDGRFEVASRPGAGTTFTIFLPAVSDKEAEADVPTMRSAPA